MAILAAPAPEARAQEVHIPFSGFFQRIFNGKSEQPVPHNPSVEKPVKAKIYAPRKREAKPVPVLNADGTPLLQVGVAPFPKQHVMIFGDSLGTQLGQGLKEAIPAAAQVSFAIRARSGTGLVNTSERDWVRFVRDTLATPEPIDLAIMMIGSNDNQPLRDEAGQLQDPLSDKWRELYIRRIDDIIAAFKEKNIPLIWVGMPAMRSDRLTSRMLAFDDIFRERVQRGGADYLDIWEAFLDDSGHFSPSGPDIDGQLVKIRAGDGVHFTEAGSRKLAFFAEREIRRLYSPATPDAAATPQTISLPAGSQGVDASPNPTPGQQPLFQIVLPESLPDLVLQPRPAAGPVIPLTGLVRASGTELAKGPLAITSTEAYATTLDVYERGHASRPKQGRADDFGWNEP